MPQHIAVIAVPALPGKPSGIGFCISNPNTYQAKTAGWNINGSDPNHIAVRYPGAGDAISIVSVWASKSKQVNDMIEIH
jgi:hypothetical protein